MPYINYIKPPAGGGTVVTSFTNPNTFLEYSQSGALNKFNAALGTLTAATLRLTVHSDISGQATRDGTGGTINIKLRLSCDSFFTSSLAALDAIINDGIFYLGLVVDTATFGMAAGTTHVFGVSSGSTFIDINLASILGALTGSGSFTVFGDSLSGNSAIGGGIASASYNTVGGFDASLTYTYV